MQKVRPGRPCRDEQYFMPGLPKKDLSEKEITRKWEAESGEGSNRTGDAMITGRKIPFSSMLQLSDPYQKGAELKKL